MSFVFQPLPHSDLTRVQSLSIVAVDGLRGWRPSGRREGGGEGKMEEGEGNRGK